MDQDKSKKEQFQKELEEQIAILGSINERSKAVKIEMEKP